MLTNQLIAALGTTLAVCDSWARLGQVPAVEAFDDQAWNSNWYGSGNTLITIIPIAANLQLDPTPACSGIELVFGRDFG